MTFAIRSPGVCATVTKAQQLARRSSWIRSRSELDRPILLALGAILVLFIAVSAVGLASGGVREGSDTPRYLEGGDRLFAGESLSGRQVLYVGYLGIVGLSRWLGLGLWPVIVLQLVVAVLAGAALFDLARSLAGPWAGVVAVALFLPNPDLWRWHAYVLPESLYVSGVAIAVWATHRATERKTATSTALALMAVLGVALLRPDGWLLIAICIGYWIIRTRYSAVIRVGALSALVCALGAAVVLLPARAETTRALNPGHLLSSGVVICNAHSTDLSMPRPTASVGTGWPGFISYASAHPLDSARALIARAGAELVHVRPYYSGAHNALLLAFVGFVYVFGLAGMILYRSRPLVWLIVAVTIAQLLLIAGVCADYDGRFITHVLPLIGVLAGAGAVWTTGQIGSRRQGSDAATSG
jgi:hypothetical protein